MEFPLIHCSENAAVLGETLSGCDLVIVAMFTEIGPPRHHENPLAEFEGSDDRPHSGMCDDQTSGFDMLSEFVSADEWRGADVLGTKVGRTDLSKNVCATACTGPFVDCPDQAIEAPLCAYSDKNHSTEPT